MPLSSSICCSVAVFRLTSPDSTFGIAVLEGVVDFEVVATVSPPTVTLVRILVIVELGMPALARSSTICTGGL